MLNWHSLLSKFLLGTIVSISRDTKAMIFLESSIKSYNKHNLKSTFTFLELLDFSEFGSKLQQLTQRRDKKTQSTNFLCFYAITCPSMNKYNSKCLQAALNIHFT